MSNHGNTRQLHFNAFLMSCGHHEAAWRLKDSNPFANLDLGHWTKLAQLAERGTFDSVFLADAPALWGNAAHRPGGALEPTLLLTALAGVTSHIGLIALAHLAQVLEVPPDTLKMDRPLPAAVDARENVRGAQSRYRLIVELARRDQLTVRQLIGRLGGGRGHRTFAGTPEQVADTIEEWSDAAAADGFNVMPAALPSGLETFVEHVIPILQKRGLARTEYAGTTLRDHYGLPRPPSQFATATERNAS